MSVYKKFAGQTAIYGLSTITSRVLNFFLTPVYVRVYPAKVYGIFTTMYSWASLLNAVLALGMETTFFRYLNKYEDRKDQVYGNTFMIIVLAVAIFLPLTFLFTNEIAQWMHKNESGKVADYVLYIRYFICILCMDALAVIPFAKVRADEKPLRYGIIKMLNILIFIGFNIFFLFVIPYIIRHKGWGADTMSTWYRSSWVGYIFLSNLIGSSITLLLLLPELMKLKISPNISLIKSMLNYSFPVLIANISFIINENIDKIFLAKLLPSSVSSEEVGIYGACSKLAIFLNIAIQAFRLGSEPFFFSQAKNSNSGHIYARIMNYFVIASSIIFLALVANIDLLKYFIKGKDTIQQALYWSGLKIVPILLFAYVCLGIYMNLSIWYKLSDQTRFGLYISLFGASITIILNLLFIPQYSFVASAWITLIVYFSMMILSYLLGQKYYPIPYQLSKNTGYVLLSLLFVVLSFYIFKSHLLISNILLGLYLIIVYFLERKELKRFFATT